MMKSGRPILDNPIAKQIVEAAPASALVIDGNGTITFANQQAERLFGYAIGELVGNPVEVLVPLSHRDAHVRNRADFMSNPKTRPMAAGRDLSARHKDGSEISVDVSLHPMVTDIESVVLVFATESSERRRSKLDRETIQLTRLAAVEELVIGLSHENRNALQRASACVDLIELESKEDSEQSKLANRIRRALDDLQRNYERVESYAAPIQLHLREASLFELCKQAFDELQSGTTADATTASEHRLTFTGSHHNAVAKVDAQRMKQLFFHLLENSIAAAPEGAEIETMVDTTRIHGEPAVLFAIRDKGSGLTHEAAAKLFEPFFTTKQRGIGLGLAICRRIAEAHKGEITARPHQQGGTVFELTVPRRSP